MTYRISGFDICVQGFERMRSRDEFILLAYVAKDTNAQSMLEQYLDDIQSCDRFEDFDYEQTRTVVKAFFDERTNDIAEVLGKLEFEDAEQEWMESECLVAPLYIEVPGAYI